VVGEYLQKKKWPARCKMQDREDSQLMMAGTLYGIIVNDGRTGYLGRRALEVIARAVSWSRQLLRSGRPVKPPIPVPVPVPVQLVQYDEERPSESCQRKSMKLAAAGFMMIKTLKMSFLNIEIFSGELHGAAAPQWMKMSPHTSMRKR
jgi:hypothetical protein